MARVSRQKNQKQIIKMMLEADGSLQRVLEDFTGTRCLSGAPSSINLNKQVSIKFRMTDFIQPKL